MLPINGVWIQGAINLKTLFQIFGYPELVIDGASRLVRLSTQQIYMLHAGLDTAFAVACRLLSDPRAAAICEPGFTLMPDCQ